MSRDRATYTVDEAIAMVGIGRTLGRRLIREGSFPGVIKLGTRYLVSRTALDRYLAGGGDPYPEPTGDGPEEEAHG